MDGAANPGGEPATGRRIGRRLAILVLILAPVTLSYVAAIAVATRPRPAELTTGLPVLGDPIMHLWILRWHKACLLEGRSPVLAPEVQAPVGLPLGLMPPLHLQVVQYILLSAIWDNDILVYNLIWYFGYIITGLGGFALAWRVTRSVGAAWLAGLLLMLSTPMMLHGAGHLELIQLGWSPLFLVAWLRFVERPGAGRMLAAAGLYLLVVMSAPYYPLFIVFPAVLFVLQQAWKARSAEGLAAWLRGRVGWLAGFSAIVLPFLVVLFWNYIWAARHGFAITRSKAEFENGGAPLWGYLMPTPFQRAGQLLPFDAYAALGMVCERASYLGVVLIGLLGYAAVRKVRFANARFWWAALGLTVVLSLGARWRFGTHEVDLPASWLLAWFPPFRLIRITARFNLLATLCASVIAAAALAELLGRVGRRSVGTLICLGLAAVAVVDLPLNPYFSATMPAMPASYGRIAALDPDARVLEIPQVTSATGMPWNPMLSYWQSFHGLKSTGGATSQVNHAFDDLLAWSSPFSAYDLADPAYLARPEAMTIGIVPGVSYRDYVWLFLKVHDLRYVVLHRWPTMYLDAPVPVHLERMRGLLADLAIDEDEATTVYDRDRLGPPARPVLLPTDGWRHRFPWKGRLTRLMPREAHLALYNPTPDRPLAITVDATAYREPRAVTLSAGGRTLASWRFEPDRPQTMTSPPFTLPAGLHELTLSADGEAAPRKRHESAPGEDMRPYSLRVNALALAPAPTDPPAISATPADAPRR